MLDLKLAAKRWEILGFGQKLDLNYRILAWKHTLNYIPKLKQLI